VDWWISGLVVWWFGGLVLVEDYFSTFWRTCHLLLVTCYLLLVTCYSLAVSYANMLLYFSYKHEAEI